jgi:hypothetical protein
LLANIEEILDAHDGPARSTLNKLDFEARILWGIFFDLE